MAVGEVGVLLMVGSFEVDGREKINKGEKHGGEDVPDKFNTVATVSVLKKKERGTTTMGP